MDRPRAADDFATIRARMNELRQESERLSLRKGGRPQSRLRLADPDIDLPKKEGALYGVPMFLKDLSGLKGRTQDSGSGLMRGTVLKATDPVIENFLHAGLVPPGRSSTPEFGLTFASWPKS